MVAVPKDKMSGFQWRINNDADTQERDSGFNGNPVSEWRARDRIAPFTIDSNRPYTPEEAEAILTRMRDNPIPAVNGSYGVAGSGSVGLGSPIYLPGHPGYHVDNPRIDDQTAMPTNPGIRTATSSTFGHVIPISFGKRRLPGNVIQSTNLTPQLVGNKEYTITYDVPIYEDPYTVDGGVTINFDSDNRFFNDDPDDPYKGHYCVTWTISCGIEPPATVWKRCGYDTAEEALHSYMGDKTCQDVDTPVGVWAQQYWRTDIDPAPWVLVECVVPC